MKSDWEIIKGNTPILLIASHNCPQKRKGLIKPRDIGTGKLVKLLCKKTKAWGIVSTSVQPDPNWYSNSPFRKKVKQLLDNQGIKIVLDIHGRRENYPYLLEILPNNNFSNFIDNIPNIFYLKELKNNEQITISEDLEKENIACAEIEIRKDGRVNEINKDNYKLAIKTLAGFVKSISEL